MHKTKLAIGFLLCCVVQYSSCAQPSRIARPVSKDRPHMKVMTYNINFGLTGDPQILDVIRQNDCDVVFLQETTPAWENSIQSALSEQYPHMLFQEWPGAGGLGILSKFFFDKPELIPPPEKGWFPAWRIILHTPLGKVQALNVHLHPKISESGSVVSGYFTTGTIRLAEIKNHIARLDNQLPTLIVGDFNENDDGQAIDHLSEMGLQSALPEFSPSADTWRWQTSVGTIYSRFDHLIYNRKLDPVNVWVVDSGSSDHLPVVGIFELKPI